MKRKEFIKKVILGASFSTLSYGSFSMSKTNKSRNVNQIKAGFARKSLVSVIKSKTPFRRDLDVVCAVLHDNHTSVAIVSLDLIQFNPQECLGLQIEVSKMTGLVPENILIHTTHTHAAPWGAREKNNMTGLGRQIANCILAAKKTVLPAKVKIGNQDVGKTLSFQRAGFAGEDLGFQTFWYGYQFREGSTEPDASALVNEMRLRWFGNYNNYTPLDEPVYFDREVDPLVQVVQFEDFSGKTIGSIIRFSAHVGPAASCRIRKFDPDFPAVVRDCINKEMGGLSMYLSGPLGNLAPKVNIKYEIDESIKLPENYLGPTWALVAKDENEALSERDRIGNEIANAALKSLKGRKAKEINTLSFQTKMCDVPLDPCLPQTREEVQKTKKILLDEYFAFKRTSNFPRELRLLANRLNWLEWTERFIDIINTEDREKGNIQMPLSALKINDTVFAFLHSEAMAETSLNLRKSLLGVNLIPVCLTGGSLEYLPTKEIVDMGGYEGRSTVINRKGEEKIRKDLIGMIKYHK